MLKKIASLLILMVMLETSMAFASNWKYVDSAEFRGILADYYIDIDSISIDQDDGKNIELHLFVRINFSKYIRGVKYVTLKKYLKKVNADKYSCNSVIVAHDGNGNITYYLNPLQEESRTTTAVNNMIDARLGEVEGIQYDSTTEKYVINIGDTTITDAEIQALFA